MPLITSQELIDAQADVQDLEEIVNNASGTVTTRLGRVHKTVAQWILDLPSWLGTWSGATTYQNGQIVARLGSTYISIQNANTNHAPESSPTWWSMMAQGVAGVGSSAVSAGANWTYMEGSCKRTPDSDTAALVSAIAYFQATTASASWEDIGRFPVGYRPPIWIAFPGLAYSSAVSTHFSTMFQINGSSTPGLIRAAAYDNGDGTGFSHAMWTMAQGDYCRFPLSFPT